ncbi:outer membrane beta-barrel protein [Helicobacter cetorum]|uniref:outer membrane beta-barrel protein n=1 Tax=Helicobacter cetorum TaxID=138563 RepID=UPI001F2EB253
MLGFNLSHALDESKLNELIEKKVKEVLAKQEIKPKHKRVDRSGLFAGLGYSGMYSWSANYFDVQRLNSERIDFRTSNYYSSTLIGIKNPSTILNGFNFKVGYQYIAPVKIKNMSFGVRGGFKYSYMVGDYAAKNTERLRYGIGSGILDIPITATQTYMQGNMPSLDTYSFFIDFLHNVYENDKLFVGYFIGAGLGGESVSHRIVQFQGYGSLGLRMGDRHHTLELSASIHGDAPSCSKKKPKTCESVRPMQVKIPRGFFESYVTWSADYVYRF